ncbi:MAG: elongation factor 1-beta [Nanoarchaeota archaeon]|nr:elongation factor 1-beta [Nanoarchaeota archaeon]
MAGIAAIIVRVMPESPEVDLKHIVLEGERFLQKKGAMNISYEEQPIAFGLKALMFKFAWPEEQDTDVIETGLAAIEHVSSAKIDDYRRVFG